MKNMRQDLANESDENIIITYGCSAHYMNLLAQDITKYGNKGNKPSVIEQEMSIRKYFRNHHLPKAWYEAAGGKALILPIEVRWNTYCDSLKSYINNWAILAKISEEYRSNPAFDKAIGKYLFFYFVFIFFNYEFVSVLFEFYFHIRVQSAAFSIKLYYQ